MNGLTNFAILVFAIQTVHSLEELSTGFHKKWYLFKMPFKTFLTFEILFEVFWAAVIFYPYFPAREQLLAFFLVLMFANGVQHLVWAGSVKKYVPGLITGIIHVIAFLIFYFRLFFKLMPQKLKIRLINFQEVEEKIKKLLTNFKEEVKEEYK